MIQSRRAGILAVWSIAILAALWIVSHTRYVTDLSAFLPAKPTPMQRLLVDQLRDGPASRLILVALEGGDAPARARISNEMSRRLRLDPAFSLIGNGAPVTAQRDQAYLFEHRYLLSDAITPERFTVQGLRAAIEDTIDTLASSSGLLLKSLVPDDPTGETLHLLDQVAQMQGPRTDDGVWISADGTRTLLVAQTSAPGSDTDAQEHALDAIRSAFASAAAPGATAPGATRTATSGPGGEANRGVSLRASGPGVFAVTARAKIERAATRLSIVSSILVVVVLSLVYRSPVALVLGLLPVASGALAGIACVALGFGLVHGITLGFGVTLIGESVDYSIYFFVQSLRAGEGSTPADSWKRTLWPTIRLGMATSVCGFASLLPSGFPGLAQLGVYSIGGLVAAALVTRFVLPELLPRAFTIRDMSPFGERLARGRDALRGAPTAVVALGLLAISCITLVGHRATLWNRELSALSPIAEADQRYDARLRADLGTADVLDLVVVSAPTLDKALEGAERAQAALRPLIDEHVLGSVDSPTNFLPSTATQMARQASLPDRETLQRVLRKATDTLDLTDAQLHPFVDDVEAARSGARLSPQDLHGTSLEAGFSSLILHQDGRWTALLPLHSAGSPAPRGSSNPTPVVDLARIAAALAAAGLSDASVLDMKAQTDSLYAEYLGEAMRLSLGGLMLIVLLLSISLRSVRRTARVLAPLILAVLTVAASLALAGQQLTILHLVGMLLIVAIGSNYALFFDGLHEARVSERARLLASLAIANVSTVIGFGLLSFSQVPVLVALGETVAPGTLLALLLSASLTSRDPVRA